MREHIRRFVKIVADTLPIQEPIHEFGAFLVSGQETLADLRPLFPGKTYVGCDMRPGPGVDVLLDLHAIDLPAESVGTVLSLETLEHVEHVHQAVAEGHRILKPGGLLVISSCMNYPNGEVVAAAHANGAKRVTLSETVPITRTSWIAARCMGADGHPGSHLAAHTSPVYVNVTGSPRPFQGAAAQHMLALVEGGLEYLSTLATAYDGSSRKRMVKVFRDARRELRERLAAEGEHAPHPGHCSHHTHG